ncbi:VOC family protein [Archangium sp.]|uniref:VOC family protein n=1 Tax=Archangium sp. TaxID=1872627 RepID=UPI002D2F7672|nr:VOC family protein [Archangium sp.]HYO58350.1 VOC family protein [Archangium sp.]
MIRGIHGLFYSSAPEATRAFFKELVKLPGVDIGEGWWIFDFAEGDLGVHPIEDPADAGKHDVSFYCDDIQGTVADLKSRGVRFDGEIADHGYGFVTYINAPGGVRVQLYEPKYAKGTSKPKAKAKAKAKAKPAQRTAARRTTAKKRR